MSAGEDKYAQIFTHWLSKFPGSLTEILAERIEELIEETSAEAVIHGIDEAVAANARNFRYVAACARNHIPGESQNGGYIVNNKPHRVRAGDASVNPDAGGIYRLYESWCRVAAAGIINA